MSQKKKKALIKQRVIEDDPTSITPEHTLQRMTVDQTESILI